MFTSLCTVRLLLFKVVKAFKEGCFQDYLVYSPLEDDGLVLYMTITN